MKKIVFLILFLILILLITSFAHKPIFDDELHNTFETALEIKSPQVSQITYHEFSETEAVFWIKFKAVKDEPVKIILTTPYHEKYADFNLYMTIFSENGKAALKERAGITTDLPFSFPDSYDHLTVNTKDYDNEFFHEPFSNTDSWFMLVDYVVPEESGWIYIALNPTEEFQNFGKVGLSVGVLERFLPLDFFMLGSWIEGIRQFHEE